MKLSIETLKSLINNSSLDYRKKNVIGQCPWCNGNEFGVSIENNHRFGCFRKKQCGVTGNIFKLLKKLNRLDLLHNTSDTVTLSSYLENVLEKKEEGFEPLIEIKPPVGFRRIYRHPYLESRGFTEEDFQYYEVGVTHLVSGLKDRIIFLIKQKGSLVGTVARTTRSKEEIKAIELLTDKRYPRYVNSATDFEQVLLGIDECTEETDTVILVEGIFGKRNVDEKLDLRKCKHTKCCCTFGAKISEHQLLLLHLAGIENIILLYDPDVVGYIKKYASKLFDEFDCVRVGLITQREKDPADLTKDEMDEVFSHLQDVLNFQLNTVQILKLK